MVLVHCSAQMWKTLLPFCHDEGSQKKIKLCRKVNLISTLQDLNQLLLKICSPSGTFQLHNPISLLEILRICEWNLSLLETLKTNWYKKFKSEGPIPFLLLWRGTFLGRRERETLSHQSDEPPDEQVCMAGMLVVFQYSFSFFLSNTTHNFGSGHTILCS